MANRETSAWYLLLLGLSACVDDGAVAADTGSSTAVEATTTSTTTTGGGADTTTTTSTPATTSETTTTTTATTTGSSSSGEDSSGTTGGVSGEYNCEPAEGALPDLELVPFVTGIDYPIAMVPDPGDPSRLFIGSHAGLVHIVENGVVLEPPFLDVSEEIETCCEGEDAGFLGMAAHPDFANNGRFFVHYNPTVYSSVIQEFARSEDDANLADPEPVQTLMALDQPDVWHYGGSILFGADGMLWYPRGDGGGAGDPEGDAQEPLSRFGKVLRIDVDTYPDAPDGNLRGADPFVIHTGLRNPWRSSFDPCTGDLWMGDVGQQDYEEINVAVAGTDSLNFGWNIYEGPNCFEGPCDTRGTTASVAGYSHDEGACAVIGGHVYRGHALPGMRGRYLYGDICTRQIWSFVYEGGEATDPIELTNDLASTLVLGDYTFASFGQDAAGELYVLDLSGTVYRIEAAD
jgi:glucose/arabinose dehydrogenase